MATLQEPTTPEYPSGVYQVETTDPVVGGAPNEATKAGLTNIPALHLAKRTQWLKNRVDGLLGRNISTSGLASGGGTLDANRTIAVPKATVAQALAGSSDSVALTPLTGRELAADLIAKSRLRSSLAVTVGTSGNYPTINAALAALSEQLPAYVSGGLEASITLLAGFVMREQVWVSGLNLGHIVILGQDTETTINRSSLTDQAGVGYPAFAVSDGGVLPVIGQRFRMNTTGAATDRYGVEVFKSGVATFMAGAGITHAQNRGAYVYASGSLSAGGAVFSNCAGTGVAAHGGTRVALQAADLRFNAGGIEAINVAAVQAEAVNLSGCSSFGVLSASGATVNVRGAYCRIGAANSPSDIQVGQGGQIAAYDAIGGTNVPVNAVSSNGIIFR